MVISVIFDTEYMGMEERKKWFLKNVSAAVGKEWVIVTHEYIKKHLDEIVAGCDERFYKEFEMDHISVDDIKRMNICYVPDELFDEVYDRNKSRSKMLLDLCHNENNDIGSFITEYIDSLIKTKNMSKPVLILNDLHVFESVRLVAEYYKCPIVPYSFSAIRKVHGYTQTLYMAHIGGTYFNSGSAKKLYEKYDYKKLKFKALNKKEILALLGKKHNLWLLPLLDAERKYEVGVIGECFDVLPQVYCEEAITTDDIYYECREKYAREGIITRLHPVQLEQSGIGRNHVKNDPATFLLNCKRAVTIHSQLIVKAAMWGCKICLKGDAMPFSFLCSSNIEKSTEIDDKDLNYLLFAYFVPDKCMFDEGYWKWRTSDPAVEDIIDKHIGIALEGIGADNSILEGEERLKKLLQIRECDSDEIAEISSEVNADMIDYDYPVAKIVLSGERELVKYSMNRKLDNGNYETRINMPKGINKIMFCPQFDKMGTVKINAVEIDGVEHGLESPIRNFNKYEIVHSYELSDSNSRQVTYKWELL